MTFKHSFIFYMSDVLKRRIRSCFILYLNYKFLLYLDLKFVRILGDTKKWEHSYCDVDVETENRNMSVTIFVGITMEQGDDVIWF